MQGWEAKALHAIVPGDVVDPRFAGRRGVQEQGAAVEGQCRWASHRTCSVVTGVKVLIVAA
jgi:hypothetical protein